MEASNQRTVRMLRWLYSARRAIAPFTHFVPAATDIMRALPKLQMPNCVPSDEQMTAPSMGQGVPFPGVAPIGTGTAGAEVPFVGKGGDGREAVGAVTVAMVRSVVSDTGAETTGTAEHAEAPEDTGIADDTGAAGDPAAGDPAAGVPPRREFPPSSAPPPPPGAGASDLAPVQRSTKGPALFEVLYFPGFANV